MLKLSNVSKYYSSEGNVALGLRNINIEFEKNEFVAIVGESGSGKTTLLNVLSGIDSYEEGEMFFEGQETSYYSLTEWEEYRKNNIGFIFQNYNLIESYTVMQNVETVLLLRGVNKKEARKRALEIIEKVGLSGRKRSRAAKLSGGEKQRVVIARAIASDPKILVCDEPTGNLDSENSKQIMELINEVAPGRLVVMVTHDFSLVEPYATRKVRLYDGEVVEDSKLRPKKPDTEVHKKVEGKTNRFLTNLLFSLRNLIMTPKRTIFSLLVYIAITFTIVGVYDSTLMPSTTRRVSSSPYLINDSRRLVVNKFDKATFSQSELEAINGITGVSHIYENDFYLDSVLSTYSDDTNRSYYFTVQDIKLLSESDLTHGRLPENDKEIVTNRPELLDLELTYLLYYKTVKYTVVGVSDKVYESNYQYDVVYGHENLIKEKMLSDIDDRKFRFTVDGVSVGIFKEQQWFYLSIEENLPDNKIIVNFPEYYDYEYDSDNLKIYLESFYGTKELDGYDIEVEKSYNFYVSMNSKTVIDVIGSDVYQLSVMVDDDYIKSSVVSQLKNLGYRVIDVNDFPTYGLTGLLLLIETITKTVVAVIGLVFLYFVTYMILNLVMSSKTKDYAILRILGANQKDLSNVLSLENVIMALIAYVIAFVGVIVVNSYYSLGVMNIIKYRDYGSMIALLIVIVAMAFMLSLRFSRRMFKTMVNVAIRRD